MKQTQPIHDNIRDVQDKTNSMISGARHEKYTLDEESLHQVAQPAFHVSEERFEAPFDTDIQEAVVNLRISDGITITWEDMIEEGVEQSEHQISSTTSFEAESGRLRERAYNHKILAHLLMCRSRRTRSARLTIIQSAPKVEPVPESWTAERYWTSAPTGWGAEVDVISEEDSLLELGIRLATYQRSWTEMMLAKRFPFRCYKPSNLRTSWSFVEQ